MRFAIFHCRNLECAQHVWVPESKLGSRGRCPDCGHPIQTPSDVPMDDLIEGPQIMQDFEDSQTSMALVHE